MIFEALPSNKAIPAVMAGIAFFLAACGPGTPPKKRPSMPVGVNQFIQAEAYREQGDMEKALDAYYRYVRQNPGGKEAAKSLHRIGEIYSRLKRKNG